ncbi:universal stress protein [Amycolatopsis sp. GM8]|uniref:universal stress protein n=1 Tax=Amycolatopsis sp. GM8 TaxID=2896530 RepID=UPI001F29E7BE|nr:universal stress protein [Amycolatopsis sp. GM8]
MSWGIVAGADGTHASLRAVSWAAEEAALRHEPLFVINAFGIPDAFYAETVPPGDWLEDRRTESQKIVGDAVAAVEARYPRLEIVPESTVEAPIPLLIERSRDARMIVLGSAGRGVLGDLLAGSTTSALVAHAKCPVLVIRGDDRPDAPLIVGVDGSLSGEPALAMAFEEAALRGAPLVAVHAWRDADYAQIFGTARAGREVEPLQDAETRVLTEALAGWQEKYPEVPVEPVAERDRPRQRLLDWSRRARLVVVGSRGRGGFAGLLLGSASQALIQYAECPVLVARSDPDDGGS